MQKELKAIIDTNVFVSALIGKGKTLFQLYEAFVDAKFTPVVSSEMLLELFEVIRRPKLKKYFKQVDLIRFEELIKADAIVVIPSQRVNICLDPKDNFLLECATALETKPDAIVTGDKVVLALKTFRNIPIIRPKEFLTRIKKLS